MSNIKMSSKKPTAPLGERLEEFHDRTIISKDARVFVESVPDHGSGRQGFMNLWHVFPLEANTVEEMRYSPALCGSLFEKAVFPQRLNRLSPKRAVKICDDCFAKAGMSKKELEKQISELIESVLI